MDKPPAVGTLVAFTFAGERHTAKVTVIYPSMGAIDDGSIEDESKWGVALDFGPLGLHRNVADIEPVA